MAGFKCHVKKCDFTISKEIDEVQWFSFEKASTLLREGSIAKRILLSIMNT
jgi:NADH pyrophosphatase NudC (nudix superfamily)